METREHLSGKVSELEMKDHEQRMMLEQVFPVSPPVLLPPKVQAQSVKSPAGPQTAERAASSVQETGEGGGHRLGEWMLLETSVVYPSTIPPQECY